jgi:hypothetical protein
MKSACPYFVYIQCLPKNRTLDSHTPNPKNPMKNVFVIWACLAVMMACSKPEEKAPVPVAETKPPQAEFADPKYAEIGKKHMAALSNKDVDGFMTSFSDNAKYYWSAGDSLIGKSAITAYWKNRFATVVDSVSFVNDIWTPLKINVPQRGPDAPGVWLLGWYQVKVKYKNGQKLSYWVHTDFHFDSSDKIDIAILYMDRAPIIAALAKK